MRVPAPGGVGPASLRAASSEAFPVFVQRRSPGRRDVAAFRDGAIAGARFR
jgi:hypothetical protein